MRSGKIFSNSSSSQSFTEDFESGPLKSTSSFELFSSSMPTHATPKVSISSYSTLSPSTLLSPFAVLASIRSSGSLLRTSNSEMILARRLSASFASQNSPLQSSFIPRSPQLNYDTSLSSENNVSKNQNCKIDSKFSSDLGTPVSTRSTSAKSGVVLNLQNKTIQTRRAVYLSTDYAASSKDDKTTDVYKFPPDNAKLESNNFALTPSSSSLSTSSRKRPSGDFFCNNIKNEALDSTPLGKEKEIINSTVKRIRLSRQACKKQESGDGNVAVVFGNKASPRESNESFGTSIILDSNNLHKSLENKDMHKRHSRGIWNFVSSVFSKYMS